MAANGCSSLCCCRGGTRHSLQENISRVHLGRAETARDGLARDKAEAAGETDARRWQVHWRSAKWENQLTTASRPLRASPLPDSARPLPVPPARDARLVRPLPPSTTVVSPSPPPTSSPVHKHTRITSREPSA